MNPAQHLLRDMFISLRGMNALGTCGSLILIVLFRDQVQSMPIAVAWLLTMWTLVLSQEVTLRRVGENQAPSVRRLNICRGQMLLAGLLWGIAPLHPLDAGILAIHRTGHLHCRRCPVSRLCDGTDCGHLRTGRHALRGSVHHHVFHGKRRNPSQRAGGGDDRRHHGVHHPALLPSAQAQHGIGTFG